jgi:DNA primase
VAQLAGSAPRADREQTKAFCRTFAKAMSQEEPHRFLPTLSKAERRGRILIDCLRNGTCDRDRLLRTRYTRGIPRPRSAMMLR